MHISRVVEKIDAEFPPVGAEPGDRIGLQVPPRSQSVRAILVCLDITESVILQAKEEEVDLIVAFHPLIYSPIRSLQSGERVSEHLMELIRSGIGVYVIHTAFDSHRSGTSVALARALGVEVEGALTCRHDQLFGMGVIGLLSEEVTVAQFLERVREVCGSPVRYSRCDTGRAIRRVALIGGSGSSFIEDALRLDADVFVCGDITYHTFLAYRQRIILVDAGHFETERFVPEQLSLQLAEVFKGMRIRVLSTSNPLNPVAYC